MRLGKVSDTVYDRSVYKLIGRHGDKKMEKPRLGQDAARVDTDGASTVLMSTATGRFATIKAVNNIYAAGGRACAVSACINMGEKAREIRLREIMKDIDHECALTQVQLIDGHTTVSDKVTSSIVSVTALGFADSVRGKITPGQDVVMTNHIGISGIRRIIDCKTADIAKVYMSDVISRAYGSDEDMLVAGTVNMIQENGFYPYMHDVSEGGILAALWDMAEYGNVGIEIDLKAILVRQEIIEICELYNINPYCLESLGCLLMTSENGCDIVNILNANGVEAGIIGRTTGDNQRIIHNHDEERFLELPAQDEIYKLNGDIYEREDS